MNIKHCDIRYAKDAASYAISTEEAIEHFVQALPEPKTGEEALQLFRLMREEFR